MKYQCSVCEYTSVNRQDVTRHFNKKVKCGEGVQKMIEIRSEIKCEYCEKNISTKPNLTRHLKVCKVKKENIIKENEILKEKNRKLEEELRVQTALANKPSINITNNNTIQLTPYNNPNLKDIEKFFDKCIKKQFMCIPKLVELIHFNGELPENHNLLLTNFRSDIMKAYKGNKWQTVNFEDITNELIGNYERDLQDWAGEDIDKVKYIEKWNKIKIRDTEEVVYKDLQQELRKVMYDNRSIVKVKN
jgi:hypothetical protein